MFEAQVEEGEGFFPSLVIVVGFVAFLQGGETIAQGDGKTGGGVGVWSKASLAKKAALGQIEAPRPRSRRKRGRTFHARVPVGLKAEDFEKTELKAEQELGGERLFKAEGDDGGEEVVEFGLRVVVFGEAEVEFADVRGGREGAEVVVKAEVEGLGFEAEEDGPSVFPVSLEREEVRREGVLCAFEAFLAFTGLACAKRELAELLRPEGEDQIVFGVIAAPKQEPDGLDLVHGAFAGLACAERERKGLSAAA